MVKYRPFDPSEIASYRWTFAASLILLAVFSVVAGIAPLRDSFFNALFPKSTTQAAATTYYVDCLNGNDANNGIAVGSAWKSLIKANAANLVPGDSLLLARNCSWPAPLSVKWNGTQASPIKIGAYGVGDLPVIISSVSNLHPVDVTGSYVTIENIYATAEAPRVESGCENNPVGFIIGFALQGTSHHITLQGVHATDLYAGVDVRSGSHHNKVLHSLLEHNVMMNPVDNTDPNNDAGAFGIALHGDDNEIAFNEINDSDACSYDYERDGASVEVYGGSRNTIHHNTSTGSIAFTELGKPSTGTSADNVYAYNVFTSDKPRAVFLNTRGNGNNFGPILRTLVYNNSIYLTGAQAEGVICSACAPDILTLRNNILWADWKSIYASAPFNESNNIYWKTGGNPLLQLQGGATLSSSSKKIDPQYKNPQIDPQSDSPEAQDLRITSTSPAINAGSNESVTKGFNTDIDGQTVPIGSAVDIGVDEYSTVDVPPTGPPPTQGPTATPAPGRSYTFTSVGDTGADYDAREVFRKIGQVNPSFFLHLGDMIYGHLSSEPNPEAAWCDFVKTNVGPNIPVELVAGNHEDMDNGSENYGRKVDKIIPCLPNRIKTNGGQDAITGKYGYEYYFDYPVASPISRHIQIAPFIMDGTGDRYSYEKGTPHYNFVKQAIDDAHANGIKWIIVSMHHTCFTVTTTNCTSPREPKSNMAALMNLLIDQKVDLIMHGHIHSYERSKQLALKTGCPYVVNETNVTVSFDADCVANSGTSSYVKGKGPLMVIVGTGGIGISAANTGPASGYWADWLGRPGSGDVTHGFSKVTVSEREINYAFVSASWEYRGKTHNDSFIITDSSVATTPTPTATPTPIGESVTLTPTADAFVTNEQPAANFGTAVQLEVDGDPLKVAYMKFDLRPYAGRGVNSAKLQLQLTTDVNSGSTGSQTVREGANSDWNETTVTFANKPGVSTNVHATIGPNSARNQLVDVDVSQLLAGKAGQLVTVAVDSISADGIDFYSRENASGRPKLIMDVATGPTSPASPTPTTNPQGSDINHDSHVDIFDLGILAAHYGETITSSSAAIVKACDLNSNGRVDVFDVGLMMRDYGT